jgi:hypothetical protein
MYKCGKIWIRTCAHLVVFFGWIIVMNRFAMWGKRGHALLSSKSMSDVCKEAFTYTCLIEAWFWGLKALWMSYISNYVRKASECRIQSKPWFFFSVESFLSKSWVPMSVFGKTIWQRFALNECRVLDDANNPLFWTVSGMSSGVLNNPLLRGWWVHDDGCRPVSVSILMIVLHGMNAMMS